MPNNWDCIEDVSPHAAAVWLTRSKSTDEWKPLRKTDCKLLNQNTDQKPVRIECGRATADPVTGIVFYNFFRGAQRQLCKATWFVREEKSSKEITLVPVTDEQDAAQIERLYQKAVQATSSLGKGITTILEEQVTLSNESKVAVSKVAGTLTMKKVPKGWFASHQDLQRGYGEYIIEGENNEMALGPVKHLTFVIHGIGEALFSRDEVKISGIIEHMNLARISIQQKQVDEWKKQCIKAVKGGIPEPPPPNRVEILPIEWFSRMHDSSSSLMQSLKATTLDTIPALRAIANDVVFDVLMYLTPAFCEAVLECVTEQIIELYGTFQQIHSNFLPSGGKCSLVGHSLGSVICWDLLSILKDTSLAKRAATAASTDDSVDSPSDLYGVSVASQDSVEVGYQMYAKEAHANKARNGTWGPSLTKPLDQCIPFEPECTILLGSPLGIFLTLRGAHPVFDLMRKAAVEDVQIKATTTQPGSTPNIHTELPTISPFTLPTASLYNIFHPSDPVAYRIEPLLLPQGTPQDEFPPPLYLTAPGKDLRLHVKAKQFGDEIRKSIMEQKNTWTSMIESAATALSLDTETPAKRIGSDGNAAVKMGPLMFPLGGKSTRVDYSLQPGVIENDYISAVTAHSTYFSNGDFQDFFISLMAASEVTTSNVDDGKVEKITAQV
jgi:hypothetical protein